MPPLPTAFRRNALANYANSLVALVLALVVTPLLVRGLGKEAYGTWVLVSTSVVYLNLLQFGFGQATTKYVAEGLAVDDRSKVRRAVSTSVAALSIPGALLLAAAPGLALLVPVVFNIPADLRHAAILVALLSIVDLAVAIPADTFGAALAGAQRYELLNLTIVATAVSQAVAWAVILALGGGLVPLGIATVSLSLTSQVARYLVMRRLLGRETLSRKYVDRAFARPLLGMSSWVAVTNLSEAIIGRIDPIVVGLVVGVPEAGVYAVGQKLAALVSRFTEPISVIFFPHASAMSAAGDRDGLRKTFLTGTRIVIAIALPLTIGLIVLARPLLHLWVGSGFAAAVPVVVCLAATTTIWALSGAGVYVLRGMGDVRRPALIDSFEAVLNLSLSIALGLALGLKGVAIATLIAAAVTRLGFMLPYVCRQTSTSFVAFTTQLARTFALPGLATLGVGFALRDSGTGEITEVLTAAAGMTLTYVIVLIAVGLSRSERVALATWVRTRTT